MHLQVVATVAANVNNASRFMAVQQGKIDITQSHEDSLEIHLDRKCEVGIICAGSASWTCESKKSFARSTMRFVAGAELAESPHGEHGQS